MKYLEYFLEFVCRHKKNPASGPGFVVNHVYLSESIVQACPHDMI